MQNNEPQILYESFKLGDVTISNRFVMASLTRTRCDPKDGIATDLLVEYYSQRASAGLILSEASAISNRGNPYPGCAAIYTKEQVAGWRKVTDALHSKGTKIFLQLWHGGRVTNMARTGEIPWAPSAVKLVGNRVSGAPYDMPHAMTIEEIKEVQEQYRQAAINSKEAGFDGVELHGAHGYLVDQFLRDSSNQRTDEYGGSIENRSRFCLEVIDSLIEVFGAGRVGIKLSPVSAFQEMHDSDPVPLFAYLLTELDKRGIAYVQLREHDVASQSMNLNEKELAIKDVCKTFRAFFKGTIMINERQTVETVLKAINEGVADLGCFGVPFISNPDLVERSRNGWPFNPADPKTFYGGNEVGYTDYPFYRNT